MKYIFLTKKNVPLTIRCVSPIDALYLNVTLHVWRVKNAKLPLASPEQESETAPNLVMPVSFQRAPVGFRSTCFRNRIIRTLQLCEAKRPPLIVL